MDEELRGFLDAAVKEKMRSGMSQDEALRAARVEMGSLDGVKEEIRSSGWESTLESLWQDLRYGLRQLKRNPASPPLPSSPLLSASGRTPPSSVSSMGFFSVGFLSLNRSDSCLSPTRTSPGRIT